MRTSLLLLLLAGCAGAKPTAALILPVCVGQPAERAECDVRRRVDEARAARDVVALTGQTDKLVQLQALERVSGDYPADTPHDVAMRRAVAQRVHQLDLDSASCVGEDIEQLGVVEVVVEHDPR